MALPKNVEHYGIPSNRVKLEVHHQQNGDINYWLFSSVAAIELKEEDVGPTGQMLASYDKEVLRRRSTLYRWAGLSLLVGITAFVLFVIILQGA